MMAVSEVAGGQGKGKSSGVELIKVVPKTTFGGDGVSTFSPSFMTRQEYDALSRLPASQVAQQLGQAEPGGQVLQYDTLLAFAE